MTENKRFELDKHDCIYDNDSIAKDGGRETYWLIEYIQQKKLVEKMNKLADENKELKFELKECRNNKLFSRRQLEKENEQLHSKNKILLEHCDDLQERNDRQAKQLDNIYNLIEKQDWEALTAIIEELNKAEEQLKIEMECYE